MKWKMKLGALAKSAEILIYGDISTYESFWDDSAITPQKFNDELKALGDDVDEITVRINSNGGSVFAGVAIHSMLKRHKAKITVYIDGIAASIASVIAMAGDEIIMPNGSMLMIHNPWTFGFGNAKDFRKLADDLDEIGGSMMDIYVARTGIDREELAQLLEDETWMSATTAVEKGFATRLEEDSQPIAASLRDGKAVINGVEMDLSKFKNAPKLPEEKAKDNEQSPVTVNLDVKALALAVGAISRLEARLDAMNQTPPALEPKPAIVATGRNIDLEIKSLELYQNQI